MHFNVIIETHRMEDGSFQADVAEGPEYLVGCVTGSDRDAVYRAARVSILALAPKRDSFSFMHVKG